MATAFSDTCWAAAISERVPAFRGARGSGGGIGSMLTPLLDGNRDGSIVDDVTSMIGGIMKLS